MTGELTVQLKKQPQNRALGKDGSVPSRALLRWRTKRGCRCAPGSFINAYSKTYDKSPSRSRAQIVAAGFRPLGFFG